MRPRWGSTGPGRSTAHPEKGPRRQRRTATGELSWFARNGRSPGEESFNGAVAPRVSEALAGLGPDPPIAEAVWGDRRDEDDRGDVDGGHDRRGPPAMPGAFRLPPPGRGHRHGQRFDPPAGRLPSAHHRLIGLSGRVRRYRSPRRGETFWIRQGEPTARRCSPNRGRWKGERRTPLVPPPEPPRWCRFPRPRLPRLSGGDRQFAQSHQSGQADRDTADDGKDHLPCRRGNGYPIGSQKEAPQLVVVVDVDSAGASVDGEVDRSDPFGSITVCPLSEAEKPMQTLADTMHTAATDSMLTHEAFSRRALHRPVSGISSGDHLRSWLRPAV